jgi:hypothetical protein
MQSFLPIPDFRESAKCLDMKRLGKQRVEVLILLKSMLGNTPTKGWKNHPAREMWRGHENALALYGMVVCEVWLERGYKDTCWAKINAYYDKSKPTIIPSWFGNEAFHLSHKSNLIRKNSIYYKQLWPDIPDDIPYVWFK